MIFQLVDINDPFATTDVAFVIGANDVVNPAAWTDRCRGQDLGRIDNDPRVGRVNAASRTVGDSRRLGRIGLRKSSSDNRSDRDGDHLAENLHERASLSRMCRRQVCDAGRDPPVASKTTQKVRKRDIRYFVPGDASVMAEGATVWSGAAAGIIAVKIQNPTVTTNTA